MMTSLKRGSWLCEMALIGALILVLAGDTALTSGQDPADVDPFADTFDDDPVSVEQGAVEGSGDPAEPVQKTPEEILAEAQAHMENGEWSDAVQKFSAILSKNPRYVPGYLLRGQALAELGEYELAIQSLSQAVIYGSEYPQVFVARGKIYLEVQQYREAADDFEQAVQMTPASAELQFLRGKSQARLAQELGSTGGLTAANLFSTGLKALDRAIEHDGEFAEAYAERANVQVSMGEIDKAVEDLEKAVDLDPENEQYLARVAIFYNRRAETEDNGYEPDEEQIESDFRKAISAYEDYLNIAEEMGLLSPDAEPPEDPEDILPMQALLGLASAQINLGDKLTDSSLFRDAIDTCNQVVEIEPRSPTAYHQRGVAQRMLEDLPMALESFSEALKLSPDFGEARLRRGIVWYHMGEYDLALGEFERAAESRDGRGQFWAGAALAQQGDFVEAISRYSNAIRENPLYEPAFNSRGLAYMRLGLFEQAAKDFRTLVRMNLKNSTAQQRQDLAKRHIR